MKQLFASKLQDQHKTFYFNYKNAKSLEEANLHHTTIRSCWYSSGATNEEGQSMVEVPKRTILYSLDPFT